MSDLVKAHLDHLKVAGRSPRTIHSRGDILRRLGHALADLDTPTTDELDSFTAQFDDPGTRYNVVGHIRAFYRWATHGQRPHLDWDPSTDMARPKAPRRLPRPLTDEQVRVAITRSVGVRHTAILLAAYAGLRVSEILGLDREHITEEMIYVYRSKGGQPTTVPTHPVVWQELAGAPGGPVVHTQAGTRPHALYLNDRQGHYFASLGVPEARWHRFRHWYGTTILRHCGDLRATQECLRHASVTSTEIYTLVTDGQRRRAVCTLPTLTTPQQGAA